MGLADTARHVIGCRSTQQNDGSKCVSMTWRAMGRADIDRHVIGCHSTQEARVENACERRGERWAWHILLATYCRMPFNSRVKKRGFEMRVDDVAGNIRLTVDPATTGRWQLRTPGAYIRPLFDSTLHTF